MNGIKERGLSGKHHVRVRAHPGATSLDLADHIKPTARRKPDIVLHAFFIRNLPQGLVLTVPYLKTSNQQIVVPKVP